MSSCACCWHQTEPRRRTRENDKEKMGRKPQEVKEGRVMFYCFGLVQVLLILL